MVTLEPDLPVWLIAPFNRSPDQLCRLPCRFSLPVVRSSLYFPHSGGLLRYFRYWVMNKLHDPDESKHNLKNKSKLYL